MNSVEKEFFKRITQAYPDLSVKKKRVADFVLKNYKQVSLMTARELSVQCDVSEPTIIRFTTDLGFSGYLDFLRNVKEIVQASFSSIDLLMNATKDPNGSSTLERYGKNAIANLENLMASISPEEIKAVAKVIFEAQNVFVVGYRAAGISASYFGYFLKRIRKNVVVDTNLTWEIQDTLPAYAKNAVVFAVTFRRYAKKGIQFLEYAKDNGATVICLTDSMVSPAINLSDHYIVIDFKGVSFVDPLAHVIAYLGALIHEITFMDTDKTMRALKAFEDQVAMKNEFVVNDSSSTWMPDKDKMEF